MCKINCSASRTFAGMKCFFGKSVFLWSMMVLAMRGLAQEIPITDTTRVLRKNKLLLFPLLGRAPETGWSYGVAEAFVFKTNRKDTNLRTSTIPAGFLYTQRKQILIALGVNMYLPKERWIVQFEGSYSEFSDKFWGLGNSTQFNTEENYLFRQFQMYPVIFRKILKEYNFFAGGGILFQRVFDFDYVAGGYFDQYRVAGISPYQILGPSAVLMYDSRNQAYWPTKGSLVKIKYNHLRTYSGSEYEFDGLEFEFKKFIQIRKGHILGIHNTSNFTFGNVPFRSLAQLGGQSMMRGYYLGRYRDKKLQATQIEYRMPLYWRFSLVGFAGVGQVFDDFSDLALDKFKISIGPGIRFAILPQEKLNFRFDVGFGNYGQINYYFVVSEAF